MIGDSQLHLFSVSMGRRPTAVSGETFDVKHDRLVLSCNRDDGDYFCDSRTLTIKWRADISLAGFPRPRPASRASTGGAGTGFELSTPGLRSLKGGEAAGADVDRPSEQKHL